MIGPLPPLQAAQAARASGRAGAGLHAAQTATPFFGECGVVVNGSVAGEPHAADFAASADRMAAFMTDNNFSLLRRIDPGANTLADVRAAFQNLAAIPGCSGLTLHVIAHGDVDRLYLGGEAATADDLAALIQSFTSWKYRVFLDAPHSGSFLDELEALRVVETPLVELIVTASGERDWAFADIDTPAGIVDLDGVPIPADPNPDDVGTTFTTGLVQALQDAVQASTQAQSGALPDVRFHNGFDAPLQPVLPVVFFLFHQGLVDLLDPESLSNSDILRIRLTLFMLVALTLSVIEDPPDLSVETDAAGNSSRSVGPQTSSPDQTLARGG